MDRRVAPARMSKRQQVPAEPPSGPTVSNPPPNKKRFVGSALKSRAVAAYVALCARRPGGVLVFFALMTAILGVMGSRVTVDPRLEALLPNDTKMARANAEARERFAATSPLYLVVESSDSVFNRELARRAVTEVRKWPETLWAIGRRDPSFFLERRLLYADELHLAQLADEVELYFDWKSCDKMPGCVNFEEEPPEPDFEQIQRSFQQQPELAALGSLFGDEGLPDPSVQHRTHRATAATGTSDEATPPEQPLPGELCSKDGRVCTVQVVIDGDAQDLEFATDIYHRGEALLETLAPPERPADLKMAVTGVYRNLPLTRESVMTDLSKTFSLSLLLVMSVLAIQFRIGRAFILLLVPLVLGTVWALGAFSLVSPTLNLISAAVMAVLAGLGDEFSQHLITHFSAQRRLGKSAVEAITSTLENLLSSMGGAALTTGIGFLSLTAAHFHGFVQMGLLTFVGIMCIAVATLLVMPPLVLWLDRQRPFTESLAREYKKPAFMRGPWRLRPALLITVGGLVMLCLGVYQATNLELEYDFRKVQAKQAAAAVSASSALHGTSRSMVLMLADTPQALEEAGEGIRRMYPNGLRGDEGASVITPGIFIPDDQESRLSQIRRLRDVVERAKRVASGDLKGRIESWEPLLQVNSPIRHEEMPRWVNDHFAERDGTFGTVGVLYEGYRGTDAHQMIRLTEQLEDLRARYPAVRFASSTAVLGEVMPLIASDGLRVTGLALLGLVCGIFLIGRSLRRVSLVLLSVIMGVASTASLMVFLGIKVDLYNMLVFPVAFGLGVDGAIFMVWAVYQRRGVTNWSMVDTSGQAVLGATMTTLVAFASLMISTNGGLASMGKLAAIALGMTLVTNLVWLPAALSCIHHYSQRPGPRIQRALDVSLERRPGPS